MEESRIAVGEVRYIASQPWPFPMSLMFGCMGEALNQAITIDPVELADARWVTRTEGAVDPCRHTSRGSTPRAGVRLRVR